MTNTIQLLIVGYIHYYPSSDTLNIYFKFNHELMQERVILYVYMYLIISNKISMYHNNFVTIILKESSIITQVILMQQFIWNNVYGTSTIHTVSNENMYPATEYLP